MHPLNRALGLIALLAATPLAGQSYSLPRDLETKVEKHRHVRRITDWGSRPEWSADSKKLLFVSREYGDLFELDVDSGRTRPLTFHFPHTGILRGYYLANGDYLFTAPRQRATEYSAYGRFFESELWVLPKDLNSPPIALGTPNIEGVAVSRDAMRIAYTVFTGAKPERAVDGKLNLMSLGGPHYQIWVADLDYAQGKPALINKRLVLDCGAAQGTVATILATTGEYCGYLETQNFLPGSNGLTFALGAGPAKPGTPTAGGGYVVSLTVGQAIKVTPPGYSELEGIFPDGRYSTLEHYPAGNDATPLASTGKIDIWRVSLDGKKTVKRMTFFHDLDPRLKSNQSVVSPDGRWMAFGVSTSAVEEKVSGQGIGLYLMDLKSAGFH